MLRRVIANQESLHKIADDEGISYETVRSTLQQTTALAIAREKGCCVDATCLRLPNPLLYTGNV